MEADTDRQRGREGGRNRGRDGERKGGRKRGRGEGRGERESERESARACDRGAARAGSEREREKERKHSLREIAIEKDKTHRPMTGTPESRPSGTTKPSFSLSDGIFKTSPLSYASCRGCPRRIPVNTVLKPLQTSFKESV